MIHHVLLKDSPGTPPISAAPSPQPHLPHMLPANPHAVPSHQVQAQQTSKVKAKMRGSDLHMQGQGHASKGVAAYSAGGVGGPRSMSPRPGKVANVVYPAYLHHFVMVLT